MSFGQIGSQHSASRWTLFAAVFVVGFLSASSVGAEPVIVRFAEGAGTIPDGSDPTLSLSTRTTVSVNNTSFNLSYGPGLSGNADAQAAFTRAAQQWADRLADPVTVNLIVDYQSLGAGILGQSGSAYYYGSYNAVRDLVAGGGEAGDTREAALLPNLPTASEFSAWLPSGYELDGNMILTSANYKALGGTHTDNDGSITFSSNYSWDFDRSDGITPGSFDFEGIAVHEMGHNLGFVSEVDYVDWDMERPGPAADDVEPRPLDLFRFRTIDLGAGFNFDNTARNLAPDGSHSFYYLTGPSGDNSVLMSTGAYNGDGYQASHWKDDLGLGIMDPTASSGELLVIRENDMIALDLIGWDVVPIPEPTTLSFLVLGACAALAARRRRRRRK
ncbi:MAG TPA: NF038122 family metalloprotease [Planctomycetota bacterium]|nr:NF038122 family metalloprotease [Planctomycetota bacterium]